MRLRSRTLRTFLSVIIFSILINTPLSYDLLSDGYIAIMNIFLMMIFVLMLLLIGPIYIKGHQGYDHIEDLYSQVEAERVYTVSRTNPLG